MASAAATWFAPDPDTKAVRLDSAVERLRTASQPLLALLDPQQQLAVSSRDVGDQAGSQESGSRPCEPSWDAFRTQRFTKLVEARGPIERPDHDGQRGPAVGESLQVDLGVTLERPNEGGECLVGEVVGVGPGDGVLVDLEADDTVEAGPNQQSGPLRIGDRVR